MAKTGTFISVAEDQEGKLPRIVTRREPFPVEVGGRNLTVPGDIIVASQNDDISINFQYGISDRDILDGGSATGTGAVGTSGAMATASTGTGVGLAELQSKDSTRYRSGHDTRCAVSILFATPEANVNQYAGWLNSDDGFCFGYQGTEFGVWFIEGGNYNFTPQSEFNFDLIDGSKGDANRSEYQINPQAANLYRVTYAWHGFLPAVFEVWGGYSTGWVVVHVMEFTNTATETHLENPSLPVSMRIERTSGTGADLVMYTGSWRGGVISGREEDNGSNRWFSHTVLDRSLTGSVRNNIVTIRNKSTYNGKTNHIIVELGVVAFRNEGNKSVAVYGTKGATLSGNGAYADIDANNSVLEYSEVGTLTGGSRGPATILGVSESRRTDVLGTGIKIYPGEALTFEVDPGGAINGNFQFSARFVEYH